MKKLFTLFTAVMLVFALGANAQSRKTWNFAKGISDASRALLDADGTKWDKTVNEDGVSTRWTSNYKFNGELTAGETVIPEYAGLTFSNFAANNAIFIGTDRFRMQKQSKVTLPVLQAGQKIAIVALCANPTATDRGFVFTNAVNENSENTILVPPSSEGEVTINLTVVADGVVDIETGVTGAAAGVEIKSIIIDEGDKNIKKWDFSAWSEATKAQVTTAEDWSNDEKGAGSPYITGDEIRWNVTTTVDANGDLTAAGSAIAELKGLRHSGLAARSYAMAFDYQTTLDANAWGPFNGAS